MKYLGAIRLYSDGSIEISTKAVELPRTLEELALTYRAAVGAQAAIENGTDDGVILHLAASLLAKHSAEVSRQRRLRIAEASAEAAR